MSPRPETSLIASAIICTGLTVGCRASSSIRPARQGVDAPVRPDVRAVAPMLAELEGVDVRGVPFLKAKISSWRER